MAGVSVMAGVMARKPEAGDHVLGAIGQRPADRIEIGHKGHEESAQLQHAVAHEHEPPKGNLFGPIRQFANEGSNEVDMLDEGKKEALELQRKYSDGFFGKIAKSKYFEVSTICMIILNALQIGWDADYSARWETPGNLYEGPWYFIVTENIFAVYFTLEVMIRFIAYRNKCQFACLRDRWFIFDASLVAMMVWETWVMPFIGAGEGLGQLSVLRLLRLLRITRIAKLMRAFPQLLMIVKGLVAATRAVAWTAILLVIITFTCAIIFTNEYHQGYMDEETLAALDDDDPEKIKDFFGDMGKSMLSLLIMGTILDDVTACSDAIRRTGNSWMLAAFILYILLNSFMMLNMLVGILVEVVGSTAEAESARVSQEQAREAIMTIFTSMDSDHSGLITKQEFSDMKHDEHVMSSLQDLGIKEKQFDMYVQLLFQPDNPDGAGGGEAKAMSFKSLLEAICRLRPGAAVNLLDWSTFKTSVLKSEDELQARVGRLEEVFPKSSRLGVPSKPGLQSKATGTQTPSKSPSQKPKWKINFQMMAQLERTSSSEIILELQRRQGIASVDEIPVSMMDQELFEHVSALEGWPSDGPSSKQTSAA